MQSGTTGKSYSDEELYRDARAAGYDLDLSWMDKPVSGLGPSGLTVEMPDGSTHTIYDDE